MKSDLDQLMEQQGLDALMVIGDSSGNSIMKYLTRSIHLEDALVVKRRGGPLTLVHGSMERDSAAKTGLELVDRDKNYNRYELLKKHEGDFLSMRVDYLCQVIRDQGLQGRLGIYGMLDAGEAFVTFNRVQKEMAVGDTPVELVGECGDTLFSLARETKDNHEIEVLKEAARLTGKVVGETQAFIQSHYVRDDEFVVDAEGEPLTIGNVKAFIVERLTAYGMNEDHGTIFSIGEQSAVPHNGGDPASPLQLGKTIIFDIFPQTADGYFHDMTRTWCLGYASDEIKKAWSECYEVFERSIEMMTVGRPCSELQIMTCEYFEEKGHPTVLNHPGTQEGYVHSLGHGIGLDVHEMPRLSHAAGNDTLLQPGHVVSVEPGLYYPEKGFGVRVEDSVAFDEEGNLVTLTDYPYDLVIPMKRVYSA
ncbi:MAG: Xaa-Pro peptidase family protein [Chloroflexota bacterium]